MKKKAKGKQSSEAKISFDRFILFGYYKLLFPDFAMKGDFLKTAFWLLSTISIIPLLAGCGGFSPKLNRNFLLPPPAQFFEGLSLLPADRMDSMPPGLSGDNLEIKNHDHGEANLSPDACMAFCYPEDPLPLVLACREEGSQTQISNLGSLPFSALKKAVTNLDSQPSLSEPKVSSPELGAAPAAPEDPSSESSNRSEENIKTLSTLSSGFIVEGEYRLQEFFPPSELEAIPPTAHSAGMLAGEAPARNGPSSNLLARIPSMLNEKVKEFIDLFQTKADSFFSNSLARSHAYESMMKNILREKNLPEELFYLALIESGFNPYAQSSAKACGIWQFMTKTAKRFGLKVDKWVDERRDPEKSTYAAAEYLKNLYEIFNCWYLATAGYNAGEGKILEAMKRAKSQDFWEISKHRYLKRETKEYVPMFLAAMIIAQAPQKYGFSHVNYHPPLLYEKMAVPPGTRLDRIARAAGAEIAEIRALNPSLIRDKTPPDAAFFEIKLPPGRKEVFENNFFKACKSDSRKVKTHKIRRGETLSQIAKKNRVSVQELCECNQISPKTLLRPGMTLMVPP